MLNSDQVSSIFGRLSFLIVKFVIVISDIHFYPCTSRTTRQLSIVTSDKKTIYIIDDYMSS